MKRLSTLKFFKKFKIKIKKSKTYTVKKGSRVSRSQDVTTKLSLGGNNDVITELFLPRGSLVSDIPAEDGKLVNLFLRCIVVVRHVTGTGSGLLGGIPRVVVQISALTKRATVGVRAL
jgi:hypothetical protein